MKATISLIKGDGIGVDVSEAAIFLAEKAMAKAGIPAPQIVEIAAGASYFAETGNCLLYTSPSPRDVEESRMPSSA